MENPAFRHAAVIEQSLELLAERCGDPTPLVYDRLFAANPDMAVLFWRDTDGTIKGEMLSRVFSAILDFIGDRRYADHMIGTEMITHEGYDVPREVFATFFAVVAATAEEVLGAEWTPEFAAAWGELLAEIDSFARKVPVVA
jgi:hemoglobin-like flavoprotein